jgi:prepilin-type N-terminal cleavage/methylation domain-containing protein
MMHAPDTSPRGFTLVEVMVASGLTVFLAVVLSSAWMCLSRPTAQLLAWTQLFQEMDLATTALARDSGGSLPDYREAGGGLGGKKQGRLLECKRTSESGSDHLWLCYDGGANPDGVATWDPPTADTVVEYYVDPTTDPASDHFQRLLRATHTGGTTAVFTVARYVSAMTVSDEGSDALRIELQFTFPNYVPKDSAQPLGRQCTLIVKKRP